MTVTVKMKREVIERDGGFCLIAFPNCQGEATTADHRANRGGGGSQILDHGANLIAACGICNGEKENARGIVRLDLIERGLRVEKASTNEETLVRAQRTPVLSLDGTSWRLVSTTERVLVAATPAFVGGAF